MHKMSRHRCNKNHDLGFACPSNSNGLRPRLAAQPRPRPQRKDKHMKNTYKEQCKWRIRAILDQKIRPEVTAILKKNITFYINKHTKNTPKYLKKKPKSDPKCLIFWVWAPPWNHGATRVANCALIWSLKVPKRDPFGSLLGPSRPTDQTTNSENALKVSI